LTQRETIASPQGETEMRLPTRRLLAAAALSLLALTVPAVTQAAAQCTQVAADLRMPLGMAMTPLGRLLVSETGSSAPLSGRISIIDNDGNRRTLLDGLPSAINDVGDPSGPAGIFLRGRTLYVAMGVGDVGILGSDAQGQPLRGTDVPNPAGPSSPLFSSVLAVHFSADVEATIEGFALAAGDQQALAAGQKVTLSNQSGARATVELVADLPNYLPVPLTNLPDNVALSNPFQLVAIGDVLYVTDGGRNLVWRIDLLTGAVEPLVGFENIPNPLFGIVGGPFMQAVPTGIAAFNDQLLVTLFRGAPFATGTSTVELVNPVTSADTAFIRGLTTAIGVLPLPDRWGAGLLVLQTASFGPFFGGPGLVLRFGAPGGPSTVVADCLTTPSAMVLDRRTGTLFVSEVGGRVVSIPIAP
jgi:hypothetical protein